MSIKLGKHIHFEGNEYIAVGIATHSETLEKMVAYHAIDSNDELWICPVSSWNEMLEKDGRNLKRFTHVDKAEQELPIGIYNHSAPDEKVKLFLSLFTGREDVFAKRWENSKKNTSGYVPACYSEWSSLCPKSGGNKMKCGDCPKQNFIPFDASAVEKHLKGELTAGVYPMFPDETCRFLAFDFDGKDYNSADLRRDVNAIREVCAEKNINMAVECSRSGKGIHFWIFFAEHIPASIARKFGSCLITYAMNKNHELTMKTYDRLIPAQDTLPKGGFGNLIALPLQKYPRKHGKSVFIDDNYKCLCRSVELFIWYQKV